MTTSEFFNAREYFHRKVYTAQNSREHEKAKADLRRFERLYAPKLNPAHKARKTRKGVYSV